VSTSVTKPTELRPKWRVVKKSCSEHNMNIKLTDRNRSEGPLEGKEALTDLLNGLQLLRSLLNISFTRNDKILNK
jgi:hypothetical protein